MKKGDRRKAAKRRNRGHLVKPQGVKSKKKLHKNPAFGLMDEKTMRRIVNHAIGQTLLSSLDIDFVGIMEQIAKDKPKEPETIQ